MEEPENNKLNIKPESDLFARSVKGGWWVFLSRVIQQIMAMARLIVLGRLLSPDDIGLLGMALLTTSVLNQFSMTGFNLALIQKDSDIEDYLSSAWTFGLIRGVVLYGVLFIGAPYVAIFFDSPDVTLVIRVIGISVILGSFNNIGMIFFQKELDFKKQFIFTNIGTLADVTVAIVLAVIYKSVWALVAGQLVGMIVRCTLSYILHDYRPYLQLQWDKVADMWRFGKHILVGSIINFLILEGDDIFLCKMLGRYSLGLYRYAYKISNMVATELGNSIGQITFPAFSKLQSNKEKLKGGYIRTVQAVTLVAYPISGGIIIIAYELIDVVLGAKWSAAVPAMQVLCVLGALKCSLQGGNIFKALNRPDIAVRLSLIRLAVIILTIYPLTVKYQMVGTALAVTGATLFVMPFMLYYINKMIGYGIRDFIKIVSLPLLSTLVMMCLVYFVKQQFIDIGLISLAALVIVGVLGYGAVLFALSRFYKEYDLPEMVRVLARGLK